MGHQLEIEVRLTMGPAGGLEPARALGGQQLGETAGIGEMSVDIGYPKGDGDTKSIDASDEAPGDQRRKLHTEAVTRTAAPMMWDAERKASRSQEWSIPAIILQPWLYGQRHQTTRTNNVCGC